MSKTEQIGIGIKGPKLDLEILNNAIDSFPILPCYTGVLKLKDWTESHDFVALWEYEKHENEWTLSDSIIDHLFVENYKTLLFFCEVNHGLSIFSTEELGHVFKYGHFKSRLCMDFSLIAPKKHAEKWTTTSKGYILYLIHKFKTKCDSYLNILDLLDTNPQWEDSLVSLIKLSLNQIIAIRQALELNKHLQDKDDHRHCFDLFKNVCSRTKATAMHLRINHRENFLAYWRDTEMTLKP